MSSEQEIREVKTWQQYAFTMQACGYKKPYAVLFHAGGCRDCEEIVPKWRRAIGIDGKIPAAIQYYVGGMDEMRDKVHPHAVRKELERLVGTVRMPTLVIMKGRDVLAKYIDEDLRDLAPEQINGFLRQGMDTAEQYRASPRRRHREPSGNYIS